MKKLVKRGITTTLLSAIALISAHAQEPQVVTDTRYARGATMAFGRIKSSLANGGSAITKRGFCIAENPNPMISDSISTKNITNNGVIYYFENLKPSTKYYMRAYATNKDGITGYGDVIKFYTLPKGNVTYSYNNGGSAAENARINNALTQACNLFCNLTSIKKHFEVGYGSGTPTADCNYKDTPWMNVGPNQSYQKTGTIMHEMQHGLGVISYSTQWCGSILRSGNGTGQWLGDRVSAFLDFWDNATGSRLNGDTQHMWPYGINGAHEDDGSLKTYYANAMIGQALGEDGLEHRSATFADPCYTFNQEDTIKYYLKSESTERGFYDSYLIPTSNGMLKWRAMTPEAALNNDSVAWYITFTPQNQYYQLRNAATGQYLTYSSGFKTLARTTLTANENFHLMKGRVDIGTGENSKRGYWIIHPTGNWTPSCLQANINGNTGGSTFNLANSATNQRWLILDAQELKQVEESSISLIKNKLSTYIATVKSLIDVPHSEEMEGTDATFSNAISSIEQRMDQYATTMELVALSTEATQAVFNFLCHVAATDINHPFDLTYLIQNAGMDATDGWSVAATINFSCAEFYEKTFDFNQTIKSLPAGHYLMRVQGYQRPGKSADAYTAYTTSGNAKVTAYLYAGTSQTKLKHICADAQSKKLGGTEVEVATNLYIPNNMEAASKYFKKGLYENEVAGKVATDGGSLKIGIRSTSMPSNYWAIFDNFRLHFFGSTDITAIRDINVPSAKSHHIYSLDGRIVRSNATTTEGLRQGIYIIGGKKVIVK